ncbi:MULTISPECIES: preprotein translocase subunit YajC [Shewanella]|jgi:preprotein translocase subunit YajC|uniref:Sec translocon accessory complex subunit YajC n=7 Tax=Shewanella TaxID=22 RepID=A0A9X1Z6I1_9GAMM|nr:MULTISPECIES: preprotein translocase subunit YajC [Shewanella]MCL1102739.1 preprotein translocase subunit YajC [Shewanella saliphila]MCL1105952.1 preprotein translocase subunit YajC [Shewanella algicola]MCL1152239.1 preprotein translocase subunit YajC [Shewanella ulleungensis]MCL1159023.1 preprotein translocase subunit YajC [Shewanella inventionis]MCT8985882.1 preprotein translocase subunit YajC [Shewanella sp. KJ10-1]
MLISNAYASPMGGAAGGETMQLIFMLVMFGLIFYFMIFRPQSKRVKEHKNLMASISKGDEVLTSGGILGKVTKISEESDYVLLAINDNNQITIKKDYIAAVLPKGSIQSL